MRNEQREEAERAVLTLLFVQFCVMVKRDNIGDKFMAEVKEIYQSEDTITLGVSPAERDQNLMLVYAVEGYSQRHNMPEKDVIALFRKHGINRLIRKNYNALHTQDLDESISFAEDVLSWKQN